MDVGASCAVYCFNRKNFVVPEFVSVTEMLVLERTRAVVSVLHERLGTRLLLNRSVKLLNGAGQKTLI